MENYLGDDLNVTRQRHRLMKNQCRDAQSELTELEESRESKSESLKALKVQEKEIMAKYKEIIKQIRTEEKSIFRTENFIRSQKIHLDGLKTGKARAWNNYQSAADRRKNNLKKIESIKKEAMM